MSRNRTTATTASQGDRERRKPAFSWTVTAILFLAVATSFILRQAEVVSVQRRLRAMQEEIRYYAALNESLTKQIEILRSDEYVEKTAREKLGLVMPGEIQYMFVASRSDE